MRLLQREAELKDIVQLVGEDALPETERILLDIGRMLREDYLRQSAFDDVDGYTSLKKQAEMLNTIIRFSDAAADAVKKGVSADKITSMKVKEDIARLKWAKESEIEALAKGVRHKASLEFAALIDEEASAGIEAEKKMVSK